MAPFGKKSEAGSINYSSKSSGFLYSYFLCYNNKMHELPEKGDVNMVVGVCRIVLSIDEVFSLKEKRHIVKSLIDRLKARFNASVAEVDLNDKWKNAVIGIACVSNDTGHTDSMMANMVSFVEKDGRAEIIDYSTEVIHTG